ncbi:MAG: MBL fold metallo-hydrolase [Patescibacteria group bacterium]
MKKTSKKITFLGTGNADVIKYFHTSFYIQEKNRKNGVLVDTGGGAQILSQLYSAKIPLSDIQHIIITHKHLDHVWGLFWILRMLGSKIAKGQADGLTIYCSNDIKRIVQMCSKEILKEKILNLFNKKIIFTVIKNDIKLKINDWPVNFFNTQDEKIEQFGFLLEFYDHTRLLCLGDTKYNDKLKKYSRGINYFIHEAYCLEKDKGKFTPEKIGHSTVKEASLNAKKIKANNLILIHTEDVTPNKKFRYTREAKKYFNGKTIVPNDLDVINLT